MRWRRTWTVALLAALASSSSPARAEDPPAGTCEPWDEEYEGNDATGRHVVALWSFDGKNPWEDASGRGHTLQPKGATARARGGRFGGCMESSRGWPKEDRVHAAIAPDHATLSPGGAFALEMWIAAGDDLAGYAESYLLDKKYVADDDYQVMLTAASPQGMRRLVANLGFGDGSFAFTSDEARFEAGDWHHVAFTYDGRGRGRFFLDGSAFGGGEAPGRESVHAGKHPLSIGDRIGSYFHGFPGLIDQVRITIGLPEFQKVSLSLATERRAYVRRESPPALSIRVTNRGRKALAGAKVRVSTGGLAEREFTVPGLAAGAGHDLSYALDTGLRCGEYALDAAIEVRGPPRYATRESWPVWVVSRPLPHRMPVVMWGINSPERVMEEMDRLQEIGFTHCLGLACDTARIEAGGAKADPGKPEAMAKARAMLDAALVRGLSVTASLSPGSWLRSKKDLLRADRSGRPYGGKPDVCALFPQAADLCRNVGAAMARAYGRFPAFDSALLHTEVRDAARPCFHAHDREALRAATGLADVPPAVVGKEGVRWEDLRGFPADRVVHDDDLLLAYYRWYWKEGDGWPALDTALAEGLRTMGRGDFWTFHDPAVRVASTYGSGGDVDVLSHWTYSYPDPIRIGTATDELLAMAAGAKRPQRVMKMTQAIWYRSQTAPPSAESRRRGAVRSPWEDTDPDAAFLTIAPMHLREAFWTEISRPIAGVMVHGWESLVPTGSTGGYRFTHPETRHELARLVRDVVRPLGPTLVQVPGSRSDVRFLESFASQMFARRGTYGWGGTWAGDAYLVLQWAGLQPEVVYDEGVANDGLDGVKVLVLVDCDVLTATVASKVRAFQKAGGIVVGDERLCPAIRPDVLVAPYDRVGKADVDKVALQERAARLRKDLGRRYERYVDTSDPDVVPHVRRTGTSDYVFVVNDRREYGDYVGQHGLVMENGLPSEASVEIARPSGFAYDLVRAREVPTKALAGKTTLDVALEPCEGRVFLVTSRAIDSVRVEAPATARAGTAIPVRVAVLDAAGTPIDAVVPLRVDVRDPDGRAGEAEGFYGAVAGRLEVTLDFAANDARGTWTVRATDLASGREAVHYVRVGAP